MTPNTKSAKFRLKIRTLSLAIATCFSAGAHALPETPSLISGSAVFSTSGNTLTVTNSNGTIIDWQKFGIAAGELTKFVQSSASSSVLNRVVGGDISAIYGTLQSNGRVWLINPAGILVGAGGRVDTAAFVASTLAIKNEDFLAGRLTFGGNTGAGSVINQGTITTPTGGSVYLVGASLRNETVPGVDGSGVITSPKGEVILAAGETVNLIDTSTPGVKVEITGASGNTTNLGTIAAEAGRIGMAGVIVRNSGVINASSAVEEGGRVFLKASQDTYVDGSGRIVTTGTKGGRIEVLGNRVAVMDNASIDASGASGGGTVLVGGDFQGKNPEIQNASISYFGPNASIKANATDNGNGGKVIIWADGTTRAYGNIEARGGANGGDGGFVETSGHDYLDFDAMVDTRAFYGKTGTLLLDPDEINIFAGTGTDSSGWAGGIFTDGADYGSSTLYGDNIIAKLATSNVVLQTSPGGDSGNITIFSGTYTSPYTNSLTLLAYGGDAFNMGNITLQAGTVMNFAGDLSFIAGWNGTASGLPPVTPSKGSITLNDAQITAPNVNLAAGAGIFQSAGGLIDGNWLRAWANNGMMNLSGANQADYVKLYSGYGGPGAGITYNTANSMTHLVKVAAPNSNIVITTTGNSNASPIDVGIGEIYAGGTVSVTTQNAIANDYYLGSIYDPGDLSGNYYSYSYGISGTSITLISTQGIHPSSYWGRAISADVQLTSPTGTLQVDVANAGIGGISVWNDGYQPATLLMRDYSGSGAWMDYWQYGNLTLDSNKTFYNPGGSISIGASGMVSLANPTITATQGWIDIFGSDVTLTAATSTADRLGLWGYNSVSVPAGMSLSATLGLSLGSPGSLTVSGATLSSTNGYLSLWANSIDITNSTLTSNYGLNIGGGGWGWNNWNWYYSTAKEFGTTTPAVPAYAPTTSVKILNSSLTANLGWLEIYADGGVEITNSSLHAPATALTTYTWFDPQTETMVTETYPAGGAEIWSQGDITLTGSSIMAGGDVILAAVGDIKLNDGSSVVAGNDVGIGLGQATSTLFLNEKSGLAASYVLATSPTSIYVNFPYRTSGGIVVDGAPGTTSTPGGSGFFVVDHQTLAELNVGLKIRYGQTALDSAVANNIVNTITTATNLLTGTPGTTDNIPPPPPPPGSTTYDPNTGQSVPSGDDEFGSNDPSRSDTTSSQNGQGGNKPKGGSGKGGGKGKDDPGKQRVKACPT